MKRYVSLLLLSACLWSNPITIFLSESWAADSVSTKWLGTAGWEIRVGETVILIDPFPTRREAAAGVEWRR